jgi:hypothetical protein
VFGRYLEKEKEFQLVYNGYENEQSISYARVDNLFEDREENIWVCTNTNGLYQFNPSSQFFTNVRQINRLNNRPGDGSVMSFIQTRQGNFLVGTWNDGFYEFDRNYNMIPLDIRGIEEIHLPGAYHFRGIAIPFGWAHNQVFIASVRSHIQLSITIRV